MASEVPGVGSVHICGFFDEDGSRRLPDGGSPSDLSPYHHFRRIERNVTHFGGAIANVRTLRGIGNGWLVGIEFETPERENGKAARMWHVISEPREPWRDPTPAADLAQRPEQDEASGGGDRG